MTEQATLPDVFRRLADSLSAAVDADFFSRLVASLGDILDVDHILVSRVDSTGTQARTLALWSRGRLVNNIDYRMAWVGFAQQDADRRILPLASAGTVGTIWSK